MLDIQPKCQYNFRERKRERERERERKKEREREREKEKEREREREERKKGREREREDVIARGSNKKNCGKCRIQFLPKKTHFEENPMLNNINNP